MSRYKIVHTTGFKYRGEVAASYNEARLIPVRDESQLVFATKLDVQPRGAAPILAPTALNEYLDYFDTRVVMFEVLDPHSELTITSTSMVELRPHIKPEPGLEWADLGAEIESSLKLTDAITQTKRTQPPAEVANFSRKFAETLSPHQTALAICERVHSTITYLPGVTGVNSLASEAWANKTGVCQDFAHVTLGALRAVKIPARYVSGYLHPDAVPKLGVTTIGESHAWVEWWAGGWFAFDPTNLVNVVDRHVVVGRGRDYDDVAPLRGVYAGQFPSELFVTVEITKEA